MSQTVESWRALREPSRVPELILGTMNFGKRTAEPDALRILDCALERGVTFWDTANAYVNGEGERILGKALRGRRDRVLVASKVGLWRSGGTTAGLLQSGGQAEGLSRARIFAACDESLQRLQTDYLDLYFLHVPDPSTPIEESLSAMAELIRLGKIRSWGTSNYASWQMLEMIQWCDREGVQRPLLTQQIYNLSVRQLDIEYFAFASKYRLHTAVYNPLAGGLLSGKHQFGEPPAGSRFQNNAMYQARYWSERSFAAVASYQAVANELGVDLATLAYAWLGTRSGVDSILIGPGSVEHLEHALRARELRLDANTIQRLDALYIQHQ
ncbi:MAG TPA: aldo/keto reductase, partial [Polyangiaceae bacterium]|nr:aldo/keto reductase [Polyangiaceae bacterium]